jgi:hypothetical protein
MPIATAKRRLEDILLTFKLISLVETFEAVIHALKV